ncbi:hypothetical protein GGR58DRAFT_208681 [Xylaria digitata]|nr:hypothetical protein GGR58DRAFT_208681 [Xylaria digitata]
MSQQQPFKLNPQAQPFYPSRKQPSKLRPQAESFSPSQDQVQAQSQLNAQSQPFYPSETESISSSHQQYATYPTVQDTASLVTPAIESFPFSYQYPVCTPPQPHTLFPSYYHPSPAQSDHSAPSGMILVSFPEGCELPNYTPASASFPSSPDLFFADSSYWE